MKFIAVEGFLGQAWILVLLRDHFGWKQWESLVMILEEGSTPHPSLKH